MRRGSRPTLALLTKRLHNHLRCCVGQGHSITAPVAQKTNAVFRMLYELVQQVTRSVSTFLIQALL